VRGDPVRLPVNAQGEIDTDALADAWNRRMQPSSPGMGFDAPDLIGTEVQIDEDFLESLGEIF